MLFDDLKYLSVDLPEDILRLKMAGEFDRMNKVIDMRLEKKPPQSLKKRLLLEKYIVKRLEMDYNYTEDEALKLMQEKVKDFTSDELDRLMDEGAIDWIYINRERRLIHSFYNNLIKTRPDIESRLFVPRGPESNKESKLLDETIREIMHNGSKTYHIHLKTTVRPVGTGIEKGKLLKAYIPIPKECLQNSNIKILSTSANKIFVSSETEPQRTVYFEDTASDDTEFFVEYSYDNCIHYNYLDMDRANVKQPDFCTNEQYPHIRFTPYIRALAEEIVGHETNNLMKARKIYDFITTKVMYSFMRDYIGIINVPEFAAVNLKGDCGVQALLFITLCRCVGVPARWQSGLEVNPFGTGSHDWAQFYVEPYGWLFADPSYGGGAYRKKAYDRWNYYFGNLDPFRMVANSEYQYNFRPPMLNMRYDPYDSQQGELEYADRGLLGNERKTKTEIIEIKEI